MSTEVVEGQDGLYVITGDPTAGYEVHRVGPPIAWYDRKFTARHDIRFGNVAGLTEGDDR